ncbi:hypothetical protein ABT299_00455 [Spirillospora sp. NPDC000708]
MKRASRRSRNAALALMADVRVAARRARFGELFVKRGLCSDVARPARLVGR